MKNINVKCFWKGSIMFDRDLNSTLYSNLIKELSKDFFKGCDDTIDDAIDCLNHNESYYAQEQSKNGVYELGKESVTSLLIINSLINRGLYKSDDMTGLLITKRGK